MPTTTTKAPAKKSGLRKPQLRILEYLSEQDKPKTRKEIAKQSKIHQPQMTQYLGAVDKETRKKNDTLIFPSLLSMGLVKATSEKKNKTGRSVTTYQITVKGKKAVK